MEARKPVISKRKQILTAGIYIGILGTLIGEDKEEIITQQLNKLQIFAKENGVTVVNTYIDRDDLGVQRYNFDADFSAKKFILRFMFIEH